MGTTLTGTTPQDTYDSLIKVTDNGPLTGSLKVLTDGLGNDSTLSLSTTAASIAGTLAVTGNATFDTNTLFVDAANNRVGVGTATPQELLHLDTSSEYQLTYSRGAIGKRWALGIDNTGTYLANRTDLSLPLYVTNTGNVGIGTSAPAGKLDVTKAGKETIVVLDTTAFAAGVGGSIDLGGTYRTAGDLGAFTRIAAEKSNATNQNYGYDLGFYVTTNGGSTFGTKVATMTSDAYVRLAASTGGIQFNGDTAAANALDDYEEGTWTMGVSFGGASVGVTFFVNTGTYTKIGRKVTVNGYISLTSKGSSTGAAKITGLPFTVASGLSNSAAPSLYFENISFTNQFQGFCDASTTTIILNETTILGVTTTLTNADFSDTSGIILSLTYFV